MSDDDILQEARAAFERSADAEAENRREAEVVLWSTLEPGSVPDEPSSAATRHAETPPTPAPAPDRKPLSQGASSRPIRFSALWLGEAHR